MRNNKVPVLGLVAFAWFHPGFANAEILSADRTISWIPGVTVGVRGAIPKRDNLLNIADFGATTNNGIVIGSILAGTNSLTVTGIGDFAIGHGIWISNVAHTIITNIVGNRFLLRDPVGSAVTAALVRHDNAPVINSVINQAKSNDVIYIPPGVFVTRSAIYLQNKDYVTARGAAGSQLACLGDGGIGLVAGPTPLLNTQAKQFQVANPVLKGTNQLVLTTNYYAPFADSIRAGELYGLSTLNGDDPNFRAISVYGYERVLSQLVYIEKVNGNLITFSPPTTWNFTNQPFFMQYSIRAGKGIGLENLSITLTNAGEVASPYGITDNILMQGLVDSWMTGCSSTFANNYNLHVFGCVHCNIDGNLVGLMSSSGTSHGGMLVEQSSGCLFQNNILNSVSPGIQVWGGATAGCAFFANYFTNTGGSVIYHNTHHLMNLFEQNSMDSYFQIDGYYGSNSHETLFRNLIASTVSLKRFTTYINIIGNVLGNTNFNYYYDDSSPSGQWPIFELARPNIGNTGYTGTTPPLGWNFPQASFYGNHGDVQYRNRVYTNCAFKFTSTLINTTTLSGNFSNWPYDPYGGYTLIFQDAANTNRYHKLADTQPAMNQGSSSLRASSPPTASGMMLNQPITISNGWTMYVSSADTFQQLQTEDIATHIRHGNYVVTNFTGAVVWDPAIADHNVPASILYPLRAPSWWGTNRWPAVGPDLAPLATMLPAQARFLGIPIGVPPPAPGNLRKTSP